MITLIMKYERFENYNELSKNKKRENEKGSYYLLTLARH